MTAMPGRSYAGPIEYTPEERELAARLRIHVESLAGKERNSDLDTPARYIAQQLHQPEFQQFMSGGRSVRNIESGAGPVVVGAHYDSVPGTPGADDNASGVA